MSKTTLLSLAVVPLMLLSCGGEQDSGQQQLSKTSPAEVLKAYQGLVDKNQLEEAKALSTEAGRQWLQELARIVESEQPDSTLFHTEFLAISCEGEGDTLLCQCVLEDQYERYVSDYQLVRTDGQWLVDAPQEDIQFDDDVMENLPDSIIQQMMKEELAQ